MYLNTEAPITSVVLLHQNDRFWTLLSETFSQVLEHFLSVVSSSSRPKPFSRLRTDSLKAPHNKNVLRPKQRIHSGGLTLNNVEVVAFSSASAGKGKQKEDEVRTDLDLRDFVFSSIIPLVSNFCARHFTISESTKEYVQRSIGIYFLTFFSGTISALSFICTSSLELSKALLLALHVLQLHLAFVIFKQQELLLLTSVVSLQ